MFPHGDRCYNVRLLGHIAPANASFCNPSRKRPILRLETFQYTNTHAVPLAALTDDLFVCEMSCGRWRCGRKGGDCSTRLIDFLHMLRITIRTETALQCIANFCGICIGSLMHTGNTELFRTRSLLPTNGWVVVKSLPGTVMRCLILRSYCASRAHKIPCMCCQWALMVFLRWLSAPHGAVICRIAANKSKLRTTCVSYSVESQAVSTGNAIQL